MNFRILGPLEVLDHERVLDVGGGKQRSVLALLLLHPNEVVSSDHLIDGLWPDDPPPSAPKIVQAHVSRLRKALNGDGDGVLLTRGHGYELLVRPGQLDVDRFRELLEQGRSDLAAGRADEAATRLHEALALWRGPPLAEFAYESFAREDIDRLEELRLAALEERIEVDLALGRHRDVVPELERLVGRHPLRERLRGQLMLALYRCGRQAEALEAYRDARRTLADELGLAPSPTLQRLERAILEHEESLEPPTRRSPRDRSRRRGLLLVAGGAVLAIAAAIGVAAFALNGDTASLAAVDPDSVGVIDPGTNAIVGQIPVGSTPSRISFGRHGVWVVSQHDGTVTRIDPKTRTALRTIPVGGGSPFDVLVGARAVWLLVSSNDPGGGGAAQLARIDPSANDVVASIPLGAGSLGFGSYGDGGSLAATAGAIWSVSPGQRLSVARIDPTTNSALTFGVGEPAFSFNTGTAGGVAGASGIAAGHGALWVGTDGGVVRLRPTSRGAVSATIPLRVIPSALAADAGAVWVVARPGFHCCPPKTVGTGTLSRIDPRTNTADVTIPIGGEPSGVAVGEGSVWVADPRTRSIVRVDPTTNRVVERIHVGGRPRGVAVGDGLVWFSVS